MNEQAQEQSRWFRNRYRIAGWGAAAGLLLLPAIAMQFSDEVRWGPGDFIGIGILFGIIGGLMEMTVRLTRSYSYRGGIAVTLLTSFLLVWINLAVGMIGSEDNPMNLIFGGVILIALFGAILTGFTPDGMAKAVTAAGTAHLLIALFALTKDIRGGILSGFFVALWLLAAGLFRRARDEQRTAATR